MRRVVALVLSAQMLTGCAYVTGQTIERRKKHSTLYESKVEQRPIPDSKSVAVAGIVVEDRLEIATQHIDQCQITRVQTFKNEEIISYELPKWHWVTLTAGLALSGGGAAAWQIGNSKIPDQPTGQL
ncbi:MAG: hypothetical protein VX938_08410, partial [Myxococcota bacterium]|nr:hypothetical protein [Myxococcota bacterium]